MTLDRVRQPVSGYNISHGGLECEPVMSFIIFLSNALSTSKSSQNMRATPLNYIGCHLQTMHPLVLDQFLFKNSQDFLFLDSY